MDIPEDWTPELITPDLILLYRVKNSIYSGDTNFQNIRILETDSLGKSLILDGKTQSTEIDEHIYHEALVHPAMLFHPNPRSVFIGGGGEGATLREALAHKTTDRVVMLDLDDQVVKLCQDYLPNLSQGAFDDSRVALYHQDARQYLSRCTELFDVIILDLVDPLENGTAYKLYTKEFYDIVSSKLAPGGLLVTQSGPTSLLNYTECFTAIVNTLSTSFAQVYPYTVYVPSFATLWGFTIALTDQEPRRINPTETDSIISERLAKPLKFYDGITQCHMFSLPSYLRKGIEEETRLVTDESPVFMI